MIMHLRDSIVRTPKIWIKCTVGIYLQIRGVDENRSTDCSNPEIPPTSTEQ